jgi:D-alanine-D-alanine ligase
VSEASGANRPAQAQQRIRVAVVFGGQSSEHSVSCVSAASVIANLDPARFEVLPVGITHQGSWVLGPADPRTLEIEGRQMPTVSAGTALTLPADPTSANLIVLERGREGEVLSEVDAVFPVLHGAYGEDGTIQGLLEMVGLPYAGAGVLSSAVVMDKEFTKKLLAAEGLPVGRYEVLPRGEATLSDAQRERLGLPMFVKPARAGSSTGITKVGDWSELDGAIATARAIDPKVLVEAAVVGREVECGVLEFPDGRVEASQPAEIRIGTDGPDWYDFEAKYLDEVVELDIPAKLDDEVTDRLRAMAVRAFHALDCQGLARVDFFVRADGSLVINELNTMPGFTPTSAYPKMWAVTGIDYPTLLSTLVDTAIARGTGLR